MVFTDNSVGATYRGRALADPVRDFGTAFSNMHRELYRIYADGNVVVVQLALQGTHNGPLQLPFGKLPATGVGLALVAQRIATCPFCPAAADLHRAISAGQTRSVSYHNLSEIRLLDDAQS